MKAYKTEIKPNRLQKTILNQMFGNVRYVYNQFLAYNQIEFEAGRKFVSGYDYSKMMNNSSDTPDWLKATSSKATKYAIMQAEKAYKNFFKGLSGFPKYHKKGKSRDSAYLIGTFHVERHRIFLPTLKWVRLKEFGYIPENIKSVTVSKEAEHYYVSALVSEEKDERVCSSEQGLGIDLGIKDLAILSDSTRFGNINDSPTVKKLEKQLKRAQHKFSRQREANMKNKVYYQSGERKGQLKSFEYVKPLYACKNYQKQKVKVAHLYQRLTHIRTDYTNQVIAQIMEQKPRFITIEDLNVKGLMKNKHMSKAIASQKLAYFTNRLLQKCNEKRIELRQVERFYSSSKLCSDCGWKKTDLQLKDREWTCKNCGAWHDRDVNAALNLEFAKEYKVLTI